MARLRRFLARLVVALRWRRAEAELAHEIASHLILMEDEFRNRGMTQDDARLAATRAFGGIEQAKELHRDARSFAWLDDARRDVQYALRFLARAPGFTAVIVLTLAVGIGANTAVFSLFNAMWWHPAGVSQPDRVVAIRMNVDKINLRSLAISPRDFTEIRDSKEVFSTAAIEQSADFSYVGADRPERLAGLRVSWQWFDVFGARPALGRPFRPEEDQPNANKVAILAHRTWLRLFGGDPSILEKTIQLNQQPYKVIGVMGPESDRGLVISGVADEDDVYVPLGLPLREYAPENRFNQSYLGFARLQSRVTFEQGQAFMRILTERGFRDPYGDEARKAGWHLVIIPLTDSVAGSLKTPMFVLVGAVGFVLLIACGNIAGLSMARASSRARELAVRAALGASRSRLVRQTFTESAVLTLAGVLIGVAIAYAGVRAFVMLAPRELAGGLNVRVNAPVMAFAAIAGVVVAVLCAIAPAWQVCRDANRALHAGGRSATSDRAQLRFRSMLVTLEVGLALVLLVGAGLFVRSLWRLQDVETGFQASGVMTGVVSLPQGRYNDSDSQVSFYRSAIEQLKSIPGVTAAAAAMPIPFLGESAGIFDIEGSITKPGEPMPHADMRWVSSEYFSTLGIPIKSGRTLTEHDVAGSQRVVVIDENLARQFWPTDNPIGKRLRRPMPNAAWETIVGVVGHVKHSDLAADTGKGVLYIPMYQQPFPGNTAALLVKTAGAPALLSNGIREAVRAVDPAQPVYGLRTMASMVSATLGGRRLTGTLLTFFAGTALVLAMLGLYGVVSYSVARRTQEIGTRMALGAGHGDIMVMVIRQTFVLGAVGFMLGAAGSLVLTRAIGSLIYGIEPMDTISFAFGGTCLLLATVISGYFPARKAARVDPMIALRCE